MRGGQALKGRFACGADGQNGHKDTKHPICNLPTEVKPKPVASHCIPNFGAKRKLGSKFLDVGQEGGSCVPYVRTNSQPPGTHTQHACGTWHMRRTERD